MDGTKRSGKFYLPDRLIHSAETRWRLHRLLITQLPREEISDKAPSELGQLRIVALAVGHGEAVASAVKEMPV
jgi:hypothetical protein